MGYVTGPEIDFGRFEALTLDCYGTLIDWETGILTGLRRALGGGGPEPADEELLETYSRAEADAEAGPYLRYREILAHCLREVCRHHGVAPSDEAASAFDRARVAILPETKRNDPLTTLAVVLPVPVAASNTYS